MRTLLLAVLALAAARPALGQDTTVARPATVTYLTSTTAYLNAGREDGLVAGATLEVRRAGAAVGVLTVTDLSSHRAAATITRADQPLAVGDSAWYRPAAAASTQLAGTPAPQAGTTRKRSLPVRGRIGVRYLYSRGTDGARTLSQPALDLRLDGADLGRTGLGVSVDVRARWTNSGGAGVVATTDGLARVYQAALLYEPVNGPVRAVVGRQMSPTLATVSFLDGALVETRGRTWAVGVVGGVEPDPETFSVSGDVRDIGGYAQFRSAPGRARRWNVTVGGMGSYTQGAANREFGYLQGAYMDQRLSLFFAQEVDYYRPWKVAAGEPSAISFTSTYANARWRVAQPVTIAAGYDNRRNVRLFRDAVTPETQFDDAFRQGWWGSVGVSPTRKFSIGLEGRTGSGGTAGTADALSLTAATAGWGRLGLSLRGRGTRYRNASVEGSLGSLALAASPGGRVSLELNGGIRRETNPADDPATRQLTWFGGYLDVALMRAMYVMLSATHEGGSLGGSDQGYVGISWRF